LPLLALAVSLAAGCQPSTTSRGPFPVEDDGVRRDLSFSFANVDLSMQACKPGASVCDTSSVVKTCRPDGLGWMSEPCPDTARCKDGVCQCTPGRVICTGLDVMLCGMDNVFHIEKTCTVGTNCVSGRCEDPRCSDEMMATNPHALPVIGWPRHRHDNRNSGVTGAIVPDNPKLKWKVFVG